MINLTGYTNIQLIYESANSLVYRGNREWDNQPVILKMLRENYPTSREIIRYQHEYEILGSLNSYGVIQAYGILTHNNGVVLILEDFGGESLRNLLNQSIFTLEESIKIAIQIVDSLGYIHKNKIIHKDINPSNIVVNSQNNQLKIIDFGISTRLNRENHISPNPEILEGTLAYISPEQTGRTNRYLDYRTDFYSLGVTLYELLTHQLPFTTEDIIDLIHCHLARQPLSPHKLNPNIPLNLSNIVMKLLAKNAEDRYQSCQGIKYDLEICLEQFQNKHIIIQFNLGLNDITSEFQICQKLYGREKEIETLITAFERVSKGGKEMMLLAGYSGIGKSYLVQEIYRPITAKKGYYIRGKFEQLQRHIPYSALVKAWRQFVEQILTKSDDQLAQWREKFLTGLGDLGQLIIELVPELELIIGKQPPVAELGVIEAQNRFNLVLQKFMGLLADKEHPLVIFLDDLQWADSATLKFIELLMTENDVPYLFLLGAYRDNEVSSTHPLIMTLERLKQQEVTISQITLNPLGVDDVSQLLADSFHRHRLVVKPLAELVVNKTGGNPFFVNQFLWSLYQENLIKFNGYSKGEVWLWDLPEIAAKAIAMTDNVVELLINKLRKLPASTQKILSLAACLGTEFSLNTLSMISNQSAKEIFRELTTAVELGLIITKSLLDEQLLIQDYQFAHDRIEQAAYALIEQQEKPRIHLDIGRLLLTNKEANIFTIVDHLNLGMQLITEPGEKEETAKLNLITGEKAKAAVAYETAYNYFLAGMELLDSQSWEKQYDLTLSLYVNATATAYLSGMREKMKELALVVIEKAKNVLEKVPVYEIQIQAYLANNQPVKAFNLAMPILQGLGINLVESEIAIDGAIEDLINLPLMKDTDSKAAMGLLSSIYPAVYQTMPNMLPLVAQQMVNLSIQKGNVAESTYGYSIYGMILCGVKGDIDSGYKFGKLAVNLVAHLNAKAFQVKVLVQFYALIAHWQEHLSNTLAHLQDCYALGLELGDLEWTGYCAHLYTGYSFWVGKELHSLEIELASYSKALSQIKQQCSQYWNDIYWQTVLNLLARGESNCCQLIGSAYDERLMLPIHQQAHDLLAIAFFYITKLFLCYLFENYQQGLENAQHGEKCLGGVTGMAALPIFYFYDSLVRLQLSVDQKNLDKVAANQTKMRHWAHHAPMNHLHKYYLVEAERHRILGEKAEAIEAYEQAINLAKENGYIQEEALANELTAKFYLQWGKEKIALVYLQEAHYFYQRWGAIAKVKDLELKYPELLNKIMIYQGKTTTTTTTSTSSKEAIDLATVIKASQAIASEIVLDKLLATLMKIIIENAGAQSGYLIVKTEGKLLIEAEGKIDSEVICVLHKKPIEQVLPISIINYVDRTQKHIVLDDATKANNFSRDPYVQKYQPKSILCYPLINQGKLSAIVYLENNLSTRAFSADRLEILQILLAQAAISIENARLYSQLAEYNHSLEEKVAARTEELSQALDNLTNAQEELIQSEKMAALGQLIAGVAHEINTPMGAVQASIGNISTALNNTISQFPQIFTNLSRERQTDFLALLAATQEDKPPLSFREERKLRRSLRQELETLGIDNSNTLANILVEVGITDNVTRFLPILQDVNNRLILDTVYNIVVQQKNSDNIQLAVDRATKIVFALKSYARQDKGGTKVKAQLTEGIDVVLTIYHNQLKQGITVNKNYQDLPEILCYPEELNQVWTNLIHNAIQAMNSQGKLDINVSTQYDYILVQFTDSGCGIPPEIKDKIFQPFFTTKPKGEGSGLGLDIVRKIIDKHQGIIKVDSQPGKTMFTVLLPIQE